MKAFVECNNKEYFDDYVYTSIQPLIDLGVEIVKFDGSNKNYQSNDMIVSLDNKCHYITENDILVGSVDATSKFFAALGISEPSYLGYPEYLNKYYGRNISVKTLAECAKYDSPYFIKPSEKVKLFTGTVVESKKQFDFLHTYMNVPLCTKVFASDTIDILTEYRCFIHKCKLVAVKHYAGDYTIFPRMDLLQQMIDDSKDNLPVSHTLDIGVINNETRDTILIEVNDFWAIGGYGLDGKTYVRMLIDRFQEIKKHNKSK